MYLFPRRFGRAVLGGGLRRHSESAWVRTSQPSLFREFLAGDTGRRRRVFFALKRLSAKFAGPGAFACNRAEQFFFCVLEQSGASMDHTGIWTQDLSHAKRMWCHYTMCPYRHCLLKEAKNLVRELRVLPASSLADAGVRDEREMGSRTVRLEATIYGLEVQRLVRGLELLVFPTRSNKWCTTCGQNTKGSVTERVFSWFSVVRAVVLWATGHGFKPQEDSLCTEGKEG